MSFPEVVLENHRDAGWYLDPSFESENLYISVPSENVTFYKKWIRQYKVTINHGYENKQSEVLVDDNDSLDIEELTREGYSFQGYFTDNNFTNPLIIDTKASEDITIYAKWLINKYTLSLDIEGEVITKTYTFNQRLDDVKPNLINGKIFIKWDSEIPITMPANNLSFKAIYESILDSKLYFKSSDKLLLTKNGYLFGARSSAKYLIDPDANSWSSIGWHLLNELISLRENETIIEVFLHDSVDSYHILTNQDRLLSWGEGSGYILGNGSSDDVFYGVIDTSSFIEFNESEAINDVACTVGGCILLTSNGRVFEWGRIIGSNRIYPTPKELNFNLSNNEVVDSIYAAGLSYIVQTTLNNFYEWGRYSVPCGYTTCPNIIDNPRVSTRGHPFETDSIKSIAADELIAVISSENKLYFSRLKNFGEEFSEIEISEYLVENEAINELVVINNIIIIRTSLGRILTWGNDNSSNYSLTGRPSSTQIGEVVFDIENKDFLSIFGGGRAAASIHESGNIYFWGKPDIDLETPENRTDDFEQIGH